MIITIGIVIITMVTTIIVLTIPTIYIYNNDDNQHIFQLMVS